MYEQIISSEVGFAHQTFFSALLLGLAMAELQKQCVFNLPK